MAQSNFRASRDVYHNEKQFPEFDFIKKDHGEPRYKMKKEEY